MKSDQIRKAFFDFMKQKGHALIPGVSLVPNNDPTLLFVNSGMFPLVPYLLGEKHPLGNRLANIQRSLRTSREEMEEIGDNRHSTMFEMMGNWSLNDYFKETQIPNVLELYHKSFGLDINRLYVSVFAGDQTVPMDSDSIKYWQQAFNKFGVDAMFSEDIYNVSTDSNNPSNFRIFPYPKKKNWWQRGEAPGELGGPDSEIFYDTGTKHNKQYGEKCHINCDCGRFIEIGNSVFMQFKLDEQMKWQELPQKNVDFGGGFERVVMVSQGFTDLYDTDLYQLTIELLQKLSAKKFKDQANKNLQEREKDDRYFRIIADHIKGATFIIADGVMPSNKDQGYILRSLIRRMIRASRQLGITQNICVDLAKTVVQTYQSAYPYLNEQFAVIADTLEQEELKFIKTLDRGLKELQKYTGKGQKMTGDAAFHIYETYGFPIEMIIEEIKSESVNDPGDITSKEIEQIYQQFDQQKNLHTQMSRAGATKKFAGGLADKSKETTMLHTTHHLLLAALQEVLGHHVKQRGSNITSERLRLDFAHNDKLTQEQITTIENIVNKRIDAGLQVVKKVMPKAEAEKIGAEMEFGKKYGELVNVYFIEDAKSGEIFSKEFCGGPHVQNTAELAQGGKFKIIKEESSGAGIRRIKATLTNFT